MYDEEIYKLACTYMAKTEEFDRRLSDTRCEYDKTEALVPPRLRDLSTKTAHDLWKIIDPYNILKRDILSEIKRHPNYTAQQWIDEYYRLIKD